MSLKTILIIIVIVGTLALAGLLLYQNKSKIAFSLSQAVTTKPEAFTELYFQNNENIATKSAVISDFNAVPYTFSFSIHDLENKDVAYSYNVSLAGMINETLDAKSIVVKNGQTETITETFVLPNTIPIRTKITVTLLNKKNQNISFWIGGTQ